MIVWVWVACLRGEPVCKVEQKRQGALAGASSAVVSRGPQLSRKLGMAVRLNSAIASKQKCPMWFLENGLDSLDLICPSFFFQSRRGVSKLL